MHLWEFNECITAYNEMKIAENKEDIAKSHRTAVFFGQAFSGKLKKLSHYLKENEVIKSKGFTPEECRELDKKQWSADGTFFNTEIKGG